MILDVNAAKEAAMRAHKCADMLLEAMETIDARDKKIEMLMEIVDDKEKEITTIKSAINTDIKQGERIKRLDRKKHSDVNDMSNVGNEELREEIRRLNEEITRLEKEIDKSNEYRKASIEVMAEILKERDDGMNDRNRKQDSKDMMITVSQVFKNTDSMKVKSDEQRI
ncbi:MAG: DUF1192 family protein [Candidatus Delongbacteria bacterium]|nr:DUF1192 family protein [Candidatus Delongbacteria bacterium]